MVEKNGRLFVVSGPSGAGKGTLISRLIKEFPDIYLSISATTRKPRSGEIHTKDYYFITPEEFDKKVEAGDFLEWAKVHGNLYGTLKSEVISRIEKGINVVLEIDVQGAEIIKEVFPEGITIFICPPHLLELQRRLQRRRTENRKSIESRLETAKREMARIKSFDYTVLNDEIDKAADELINIVKKEMIKNDQNKDRSPVIESG